MMGLWNKLARPQERNAPFRLCALLLPRPGKAWRILLSGHPRGRGRGSARFRQLQCGAIDHSEL